MVSTSCGATAISPTTTTSCGETRPRATRPFIELMRTPATFFRRPAVTALDIHVGAVIVFGAAAIVSSLHAMATHPPPLNALLFAGLGLVAGACAVKIPGLSALVSASDTFFIASAMLAGPACAMVAMTIDSTALALRRKSGIGLRRLLFNATAPSLSLWAGTSVFQLMGGHAYA